jgi:hypothetical protein
MRVAGNAVNVAVADGNERLVEILLGFNDAGGTEQRAVRRAFKTFFDDIRTHMKLIYVEQRAVANSIFRPAM